jgi:probable HAF family extracellular repeat protein
MESRASILSAFTVCFALPFLVGLAQGQPIYKISDLGNDGGSFATGMSILNVKGFVGGYGNLPDNASQHALEWRDSSAIDLGTLGGPDSALYGTTSGFSETNKKDPLGQDFCEYGTFLICLPFVLKSGFTMTPLPTLGGYNAVAYYNNTKGQTVGVAQGEARDSSCEREDPGPPYFAVQVALPAIWQNGKVKTVPLLPGDFDGEASGINNLNEVVGFSGSCFNISIHAWIWAHNQLVNLGSLGGATYSAAESVNDSGQVTGSSDLPGDLTNHAFLWENGVMTDLGTLPGDYSSYGNSINDLGQIVGESCDVSFNCRAFLWQDGTMYDLNALVPATSSPYLVDATSINDYGSITGYAYNQNTGNLDAFLALVTSGKALSGPPLADVQTSAKVILPAGARTELQHRLKRAHYGVRPAPAH